MNEIKVHAGIGARKSCEVHIAQNRGQLPQDSPGHWQDRDEANGEPPALDVTLEIPGAPGPHQHIQVSFCPNPSSPQTLLSEGAAASVGLCFPDPVGYTIIEDNMGNLHLLNLVFLKLWLCGEQLCQNPVEVAVVPGLGPWIALLGLQATSGCVIGYTPKGIFCAPNVVFVADHFPPPN